MRDIKALHPELQLKFTELTKLCLKNGISIAIGECVRTVAEQNALYAQGRTTPGNIVTNCTGSAYQSMHQWGVAFDFYLFMDIDGDGQTADDAFNNATGCFDRVGKLGQSIGLEWGGAWTSPVDKPHFQLPNWGSTANKLKSQYGTPDKFMATWAGKTIDGTTGKTTPSKTKDIVLPAESKKISIAGTYKAKENLVLRAGAGKKFALLLPIEKGTRLTCYGYYTKNFAGHVWLFVQYGKYTGYVYSEKCKKI